MATLMRELAVRRLTNYRKCAVVYQVVRNHWNKDFKPGPYPKTQEERDAAAKKYGLLPSEYEPYPDDGLGSGDYPKLPDISGDAKDPYYPWDYPEFKRNFNEPVHADADMIGEDRIDCTTKPRLSLRIQLLAFLGTIGGFAALHIWGMNFKMFRPVLPKQYPHDGPHYTFEPAN